MTTLWKLILAGLVVFVFAACGEEPPADGETGGDGDADGDTDADADIDTSPITSLDTLVGKSYRVEFLPGFWDKPNLTIGEDIGGNVPPFVFQITTVDVTTSTFTALFGTAVEGGGQDMCNKTVEVTGSLTTTDKTSFAFNTLDLQMIITGSVHPDDPATALPMQMIAPIYNFSISGDFVNQGDKFKNGTINAVLDSRDVSCMFVQLTNPTPDSFCSTMADEFEYNCEPCAYNGATAGNYCVTLGAHLFKSDAVPGMTVQPVADFNYSCVNDARCGN